MLGSSRNLNKVIIPIAQTVAKEESNKGKITPRLERKVKYRIIAITMAVNTNTLSILGR